MKQLYAHILQAEDLLPSSKDAGAFARVKLGGRECRTRTVRGSPDPVWNEEFVFELGDERLADGFVDDDELQIFVFCEQQEVDDRQSGKEAALVGYAGIPVRSAFDGRQTLPPTWFSLQPSPAIEHSTPKVDHGKILLSMSLHGGTDGNIIIHSLHSLEETQSTEKSANMNGETQTGDSENHDLLESSDTLLIDGEKEILESPSKSSFREAVTILQSRDETQIPGNLQGGILLDKTYAIDPKDMNAILFEPNSEFRRALVEQQGTTEYEEGAWTWKDTEKSCLTRSVTYTRAATKLVKSVKAIEEQNFLIADGKNFMVSVHVTTPDVPYGNCFQVELLYKIMPGPQLSTGEETTRVMISWNVNFSQSTVMKSIIEGSAQQGLKENYETFAELLAQYAKPVTSEELVLGKDQLMAQLQVEHQSKRQSAIGYLCNLTLISTIFMGLYVLLHILLSVPGPIQGLEFKGLDLPDTSGELMTSAILVLLAERAFNMVSHFMKARLQSGDSGIKAQGDGWFVTVALMEGSNFPALNASGFPDPYVVFSCSGQTRTSSIQLQTRDPQWNELLEFDAMQEPPSVLEVEVFDFDGPFGQALPLGQAEINFVRYTAPELADMWLPLEGKLAQASDRKIHLRVFLENPKGSKPMRDYLHKMEKEVGKKLSPDPHRNSTFQRLFGLPNEEFLIQDFSCSLKRKLPLQGRLFLSARIIGFHANFFGHKTHFFFLWEDIEDIQVLTPSFSTVGSSGLLFILKSGHGLDARHGAKSQDKEGRLRFQFQSFVSFDSVHRTVMALWRSKSSTAEQTAKLEEDGHDRLGISGPITKSEEDNHDQSESSGQSEDGDYTFASDGTRLSKAFSSELAITVEQLMEIFKGVEEESRIMEKVGCLNYTATQWKSLQQVDVYERHITYKFNRHVSIFGGEVTSTQHKSPSLDHNGWTVDEVMTLHSVPLADHFRVCLKYVMVETFTGDSPASRCELFLGVKWMKKTKFRRRITKNICNKLVHRSKEIFELAEKEIPCPQSG